MRGRRSTWLTIGAVVICLFVAGSLTGFGWTAQIRLDSGDLRYCFLSIPLSFDRMPEPQRSAILAIARESGSLPTEWRTCAIYPLPTSNNPDSMCRGFYHEAAAWVAADRTIARMALEDIAAYVRKTKAQYLLPDSVWILGPVVVSWETGAVPADWRTNDMVQMYCENKGYAIPEKPASAPIIHGDNP